MKFAEQEELNQSLAPVLKELALHRQPNRYNNGEPYFTGFKFTDMHTRGLVGQMMVWVVGQDGRPWALYVNLPGMEIGLVEEGSLIQIGIKRLDDPFDIEKIGAMLREGIDKLDQYAESHGLKPWREDGGEPITASNVVPDSKIECAARTAHEANRILCLSQGDSSQPTWEDAPEWQVKSALLGATMILNDPSTTPEQSHEGWMKTKVADGWKYGPVKDANLKVHPCMVPYAELPENQRLKDEMFGLVVRAVLGIE